MGRREATSIGVHVDDDAVRVVRLARGLRGRRTVTDAAEWPLPRAAVVDGVVRVPEQVASCLGEVWAFLRLRERSVRVATGSFDARLTVAAHDRRPRTSFADQLVAAGPAGSTADRTDRPQHAVASAHELARLRDAVTRARLTLAGIDVVPAALARALDPPVTVAAVRLVAAGRVWMVRVLPGRVLEGACTGSAEPWDWRVERLDRRSAQWSPVTDIDAVDVPPAVASAVSPLRLVVAIGAALGTGVRDPAVDLTSARPLTPPRPLAPARPLASVP